MSLKLGPYNNILHTSLQDRGQNINQSLNSDKRHPLHRPNDRAMRCLLRIFRGNLTALLRHHTVLSYRVAQWEAMISQRVCYISAKVQPSPGEACYNLKPHYLGCLVRASTHSWRDDRAHQLHLCVWWSGETQTWILWGNKLYRWLSARLQ